MELRLRCGTCVRLVVCTMIVLAGVMPQIASAECIGMPDTGKDQRFRSVDVAFRGTIKDVRVVGDYVEVIEFDVAAVWKGKVPRQAALWNRIHPERKRIPVADIGTEYVVFGQRIHRSDRKLYGLTGRDVAFETAICDYGTGPVSRWGVDLLTLGPARPVGR